MPAVAGAVGCSPRTWGWSAVIGDGGHAGLVLPTHVGMVRRWPGLTSRSRCAPHARGDGPAARLFGELGIECSPRTWGWSAVIGDGGHAGLVLPTHVGMVLFRAVETELSPCAPHARGDGPAPDFAPSVATSCSPRTWGWSDLNLAVDVDDEVLPTHVGMVRPRYPLPMCAVCAPHARGDGPTCRGNSFENRRCSPRTWGWSRRKSAFPAPGTVLPTHVGMVRRVGFQGGNGRGAPHARGDGPPTPLASAPTTPCSPRTWGWSARRTRASTCP